MRNKKGLRTIIVWYYALTERMLEAFRSKVSLIGFANNIHIEKQYEHGRKETSIIWSVDLNAFALTRSVINKYFYNKKPEEPERSYDEPLKKIQKITLEAA